MGTPSTRGSWGWRLGACAAAAFGAAIAGAAYVGYRNTSALAGLELAFTAGAWAMVVGLLALGACFLPGGPRFAAFAALFLLPWVLPIHKVARHWTWAFNVQRCEAYSGKPADECRAADCQSLSRCVPGGDPQKGLCRDTGSPLSSIHCDDRGGVCTPRLPRCAGVAETHCASAAEGGVQICQWNGSACVEKVSVCGGCKAIALKCEAMPFEVTLKAPWNRR